LIERVDGDVNALAGFFSSFVVQFVGSILLLLGVLAAVYIVDLRLGLAFTLFAGLALLLLSWIRRFGTPHWHADREQSALYYGYIGEAIGATEDLRANGAVPYAMRRFFEALRSRLPVSLRAEFWASAVWIAAVGVFTAGDALAYGLGGSLYRLDAISLGSVYLLIAYSAMLAAPIETIRVQLQDLQRADASVVRVRELLEQRSRLGDGALNMPAGAVEVEFRDVSFGYEDRQIAEKGTLEVAANVLDRVSFRLEAGRVLGLLGRTGSGKTTIARLLFRLYDPRQGEVRVGGVDLRDASLVALRGSVGLVTQDVQLFEASLRDNITFFDATIADGELRRVLSALGLDAWVERLPQGLDTLTSSGSLSAGEAQLVALARVFIRDPGLVVLDEASSRLDPATEELLARAMDRLLQRDGARRTAIVIAHRLRTVVRADDILILEGGRVVEHGPRAELAANPSSRFAALRRAGIEELLA
jgi:ABC-type multidrug transport system fused ATPase/permease subunit